MPRPTRDRYTATVMTPDPAGMTEPTLVDHTVEITPADQLRAELEGRKQGLGPMSETPLAYTLLWIWCALTRTHLYAEDWQTFINRDLYGYGTADDDVVVHETWGGESSDPTSPSVQFASG